MLPLKVSFFKAYAPRRETAPRFVSVGSKKDPPHHEHGRGHESHNTSLIMYTIALPSIARGLRFQEVARIPGNRRM